MSPNHHEYMQRALRLAANGLYTTEPNPRVGCVIVNDGEIVGEGWHRVAGAAHAEVNALAQAGGRARGATAYVTMEPCDHTGKTGPCSQALVDAGVGKVIAAMVDPNPLVSGRGLETLEKNGIHCESGLLEEAARRLNPGFIKRMEAGRPYVRLKMAMSLDGRTAMASGESKWITGEAARADVQRLRARSSAIMTGIGTVIADDPRMDVRLSSTELTLDDAVNTPMRVVLDSDAKMSPAASMFDTDGGILQVTANDVTSSLDSDHLQVDRTDDGLSLTAVLGALAEREVNELHVECGATLAGALLQEGLVDELVVYMAPHIMGDGARGLFHLPAMQKMEDRISLEIVDVRMIGEDMRLTANVKNN